MCIYFVKPTNCATSCGLRLEFYPGRIMSLRRREIYDNYLYKQSTAGRVLPPHRVSKVVAQMDFRDEPIISPYFEKNRTAYTLFRRPYLVAVLLRAPMIIWLSVCMPYLYTIQSMNEHTNDCIIRGIVRKTTERCSPEKPANGRHFRADVVCIFKPVLCRFFSAREAVSKRISIASSLGTSTLTHIV